MRLLPEQKNGQISLQNHCVHTEWPAVKEVSKNAKIS